jgi:hypothetical protein
MNAEGMAAVISRVQEIETDVGALRRALDTEQIAEGDRQYVSRCFDLLAMELEALRQYLRGLSSH